MKIQLYENQHIKNGSSPIELFSVDQAKGGDTTIAISCSNDEVKTNLTERIGQHLSEKRDISEQTLNELLDEALLVTGGDKSGVKKRLKDCNLSMMLIHSKGVKVMQMGEGRILQVRPHEKIALYDSRDQVLDIYTSHAKVMELTDILSGDYFLMTTKSRIDMKKVVATLCDSTIGDDQKYEAIEPLLDDESSMLIQHVDRVEGNTGFTLPDLDKKWKTVIGLLAAVVIALAAFSFLPKCEFKSAPENEVSTESETSQPNAGNPERPDDAVNEGNTETTEAPADDNRKDEEKSEAKSEKNDKKDKDKKDEKKEQKASSPSETSSEPAKPAEDKLVEPVKPVTPVTPQVTPVTPPATPPPATQE